MHAAVFLDRDDTLIHNPGDLGDPAAVRLVQGAAAAIGSLRGLGYKIVVVTNQGGVARGKYGEEDVEKVHQRINQLVRSTASGSSIDRFYYCPFHPEGSVEKYRREHPWRKPQPGMLLQAANDLKLDLGQCWMIGDQLRDIEAGLAAGVRTILVHRPEQPPLEADGSSVKPHFTARSLVEAVRIVAQQRKPELAEEGLLDDQAKKRPTPVPPKPIAAAKPAPPAPTQPPRPFRPWGAEADEPTAKSATTTPTVPAKDAQPSAPTPHAPTPPPSAPESAPAQSSPPTAEAAAPKPTPESVPEPETDPLPASAQVTLRKILQELRNQRVNIQEFSTLGYLAIILQLGAALCLIAAFLLSPQHEFTFFKWLGTGLFIQLAVIAVLMFDRE